MKKSILLIAILSASIILCACSQGENAKQSDAKVYKDSDGAIVYEDNVAQSADEGSLIERDGTEPDESAPEGSISLENAKAMLDTCCNTDMGLPQSVKEYKKYYFNTVKYNDIMYYSIYLYVEKNAKRIFMGTNYLVACDGSHILKETLASDYVQVTQNVSSKDKKLSELFGNQKITPNEAALTLTKFTSKQLGLNADISSYTFDADTKIDTIKSIKCYKFTPKLCYSNSIEIASPIYVIADGSGRVFEPIKNSDNEYKEIK